MNQKSHAPTKPFDAATKRLVESQPSAWLAYLGLPGENAELINVDLTTITTEADRALRVNAPTPYLSHIEFQSSYDTDIDDRVLRYNVLLYYRHRLPVLSVVVLLRREADGPQVKGEAGYSVPMSEGALAFRYRIVRVWEKSAEEVLTGGLPTLPLAPLADIGEEALGGIIARMERRIDAEASASDVGMLWTATYLLMGLRYERGVIQQLLKGVRGMKESTTYQEILEEGEAIGLTKGEAIGLTKGESIGLTKGKAEEARSLVLRLGGKRFGPPDASTQAAIEAIPSLERLEALAERLLEAENWRELLN